MGKCYRAVRQLLATRLNIISSEVVFLYLLHLLCRFVSEPLQLQVDRVACRRSTFPIGRGSLLC